ncbi:iron-sulfur cluster biosynthesis family protein [Secundilactobacillus malefermentans]|uniref:Core domain-containing protein n=1 Tax=Secundilactobacillus malefermentans TaxID=176292 RepID=A0A4R5NDN2_9LACO|nr:iron-sulfur cluster biosynthesis family protein [Secundilactobacillus malefermentans]QEA32422.1 iron-sulfur cluster biosynthesis family protein [Secundilactobacillus malefermentans]TDG71667.1 hypothetical protein C5L31_000470 [Secundilactobacillus malefermentans]
MKLTISDEALAIIQPNIDPHTIMLLSYDDGVGPYSHHGLEALQIAFQLVLITDKMDKKDYDLQIKSNIGLIYAKGYSSEFFGENMKITYKPAFNLLNLSDDGEEIEDNLQIIDERH